MLKNILLLTNPRAGGGRAQRLLPDVERRFRAQDIKLTTCSSTAPGSLRSVLAQRELAEVDAVVVAGGDGTLFEALNGLMAHRPEARPPLGVVPLGTGNAFARDLGLQPGDWQASLALIFRGACRPIDVGQVDCADGRLFFLNIAGIGFVVAGAVTASRLKAVGKSAYTLAALWQALKLQSSRLRIEIDGQLIEQDNLFAEISNSRFTGTSFLMAPAARLDDGLLDVTLVRKLSRLRLLSLFPTIYSGSHVNYPEVTVMQGRHIHIYEPVASPMLIDGEFIGVTPAEIRCLPAALRVFA